jgi:hypothetical protein
MACAAVLPKDFPAFTTAQGYFYGRRDQGLFGRIYAANLPGFLRILSDPRQKVSVVPVLAAGLLGFIALLLLDCLPQFVPRL